MPSFPSRRAAVVVAVFAFAQLALAAPPAPKPKEQARYGIYLQNQRIGAMVTRTFDVRHASKPALRLDSDMDVKIQALGQSVEQKMQMSHLLDGAGKPITSSVTMTSSGRTTRISAKYEPQRVVCEVDAAGQKSNKIVPIPRGITLIGDPDLTKAKSGQLKVGQKSTMHFFEPMTLTIQKIQTEVVKEEKRDIGGKPTRVFLMKSSNSFAGESESWLDAEGRLLEDKNSLGLRMVREDLGAALPQLSYEPPKDFAVATSVMTAVKIPEPRKLNLLRLKVSGLPDKDLLLSDVRQKVEEQSAGKEAVTATFRVQTRELPTVSLPLAAAGEKGPGLDDAPYLGLADPGIRKQALALADGAPDRAAVARRVRAWVHGHMKKPSNVGTPRSAAEIMASQDGVCRDYATLFAAVARAAGVPTRICSGIVYFENGFFYHAWVECQLQAGSDGWYALDPTLDTDFVDATHIKFAQGDPLDMYGAVRVVGQIKAEVLEYK